MTTASGAPALETVTIAEVYLSQDRYNLLADGSADFAVFPASTDLTDLVGETCAWDEALGEYAACVVNDEAKPLR